MLTFKRGNIFTEVGQEPIFVTLNSFIKKDGALYMARGAGLGCLRRASNIDVKFGELIRKYGVMNKNAYGNKFHKYGIVYDAESRLGAFQIKYHLNDSPELDLIKYSATMLAGVGRVMGPIHLNFPGLGNDTINRPELYRILEEAFRNVDITLWRLENKEESEDDSHESSTHQLMGSVENNMANVS